MMELSEQIYNSNRAKEVLENEAYIKAFADIEQEFIEAWKTSPARDEAGREKLWQLLSLLHKLKSHIKTTMETGKLAALELEHKRNLSERLKDARSALWQE